MSEASFCRALDCQKVLALHASTAYTSSGLYILTDVLRVSKCLRRLMVQGNCFVVVLPFDRFGVAARGCCDLQSAPANYILENKEPLTVKYLLQFVCV